MAPSREEEEQRLVEQLWATSARAHTEAGRRTLCADWADYHRRLAKTYASAHAYHERVVEEYEALLKSMCTRKGAA